MTFDYTSPAIEAALVAVKSVDEMEEILKKVRALQFTFSNPEIFGRRLFTSNLDQILKRLPQRMGLHDVPLSREIGPACIVATEFYNVGGHTRVAQDIAHILGDQPPVVILTDVFNRVKHQNLFADARNPAGWNRRAQLMVGADRLVDKIVELYNLILALRPSRIFMLTHHMDVVGMAALWPFRDVVEFVHHADHLPALGATLPFAAHVDLTWPCHQQCKMKVGNAYFAGLQGALPLEGAPPRPPASDRIVIATCASPSKYTGLGTADHRWTDYVTIALADPRVEIVHMGPFTEELAAAVSGALTDASIDPNRYRFVGPVPSLQKALIEHQANIYLGSYPTPGGKATLEAMAAGYSPIQPIDTQMPDQLRFDMPGGMWVEINTPEQLPAALEKVLNVSPEEAETARLEVVEMNSRFERYASQGVSSTD